MPIRRWRRSVPLAFLAGAVVSLVLAGSLLAAGYTASVANLTLAALSVSHTSQTNTGTLTLSAADTSATGAGWNVTLQASALVYSGTNGTSPANDIAATNLVLGTPGGPLLTSGQAIDPTNGPRAVGSGGALNAAIKVISANIGYGAGTYSQQLPVSLSVPGNARAGTYSATLTVTMVAGP